MKKSKTVIGLRLYGGNLISNKHIILILYMSFALILACCPITVTIDGIFEKFIYFVCLICKELCTCLDVTNFVGLLPDIEMK